MEYIIDHIKNYSSKDLLDFYNNIKTPKKDRISKLIKEEDKLSSILGEYLLSELLKKHNIDYNKINIIYNKNNKPYIENNPLYFNISHKDGYVAVVVSKKECGIDIETIKDINIKSINIFANKKEQEYILQDKSLIKERYYEIYTLKEATIKMHGNKLSNIKTINTNNKKTIINNDKYYVTIIEPED